jgi:hypothetical protein
MQPRNVQKRLKVAWLPPSGVQTKLNDVLRPTLRPKRVQ